ncbi:MAG TPA: two-component regulator propeller domain-containing protein, partial [Bacillota bacterium]|nr:two-component regulator propeller domain-containing protein [Bacillota bacterium]
MNWKRWKFAGVWGVLVLSLVLGRAAKGADYLMDVWDTEQNLPNSSVTAVAQTPDGYLWVGTYNGLARFDGVRFVTFDPVNTPALGHARIQDFYLDARGTLWINTYRGGLTSYRNGVFQQEWPGGSVFDIRTALVASSQKETLFVTQQGEVLRRTSGPGTNVTWTSASPAGGIRMLFQCRDAQGTLWFLTRDSHIVRYAGGEFHPMPETCGLTGARVATLAADAQGRVWAGTERELARWDGRAF